MLSLCVVAAWCVTALLLPAAAGAGVKSFTPEDFRALDPSAESYFIVPAYASSDDLSNAYFWAPVKLPVGVRIKKLTLLSWGGGNPHSSVKLIRTRTGKQPLTLMQVIDNIVNTQTSPPTVTSTKTPFTSPEDLVVRKGYRYHLEFRSAHHASYIHAARVRYR
jgi:hypothetical protein